MAREATENRPGPGRRAALRVLSLAAGLLLGPACTPGQENIESLRTTFNNETDPVRKAKLLPKLGEAQLGKMRGEADAGNYEQALRLGEELPGVQAPPDVPQEEHPPFEGNHTERALQPAAPVRGPAPRTR